MKLLFKTISALVLTSLLLSTFTVPPALAQTEPPDITITPDVDIMFQEVDTGGHSNIEYDVVGNGTPVAVLTATITTGCSGDGNFDTFADFCPLGIVDATVTNDTGGTADLFMCWQISADPDNPAANEFGIRGRKDREDSASLVDEPLKVLPYSNCMLWTLANSETTLQRFTGHPNATGMPPETAFNWHFVIWFSWVPLETCDENFSETTSDEFEIDPTIETPVGSPTDDQLFETVDGEYYSVGVSGEWNDGANDRKDAAYSWDGSTWYPLSEIEAECVQQGETGGASYVIVAESETFYIRANDSTGNFGDNTQGSPVFSYTIAALVLVTAPCDSQYTYDEFTDLLGHTGVAATDEDGALANNNDETLVVGEWYVIRWTSGYWQDDGGPDRTDLEFSYDQATWSDLGAGGAGVWCATADGLEVLFQATAENVYIRVNNETGTFASNTGNPFYDLYQVTFIRTPTSCETRFTIGDLIHHDVVDGDQSGGKRFAFLTTRPDGSVWGLPSGLEYGAWYVIDTTDGPWREFSFGGEPWQYTMAVSEDGGETWESLASWDYPVCNFEIDGVGHRRIVFQMPFTGSVDWLFRVDDDGLFVGNQGSLEWDLYAATSLESEPQNGQCDYSYDVGDPVALGEILGTDADGVPLTGMTAGQMYALKVIGTGYGWQEEALGDDHFDSELTENGGSSWVDIGDWTQTLCAQEDGDDTTIWFVAGINYNYALRVNSTTFDNNTGSLGYAIYPAEPGQSVVNTCFDGWSLQIINEFDWLDVREEGGELLSADTARFVEFIALVPGRVYMVETPAGQGPWGSLDEPSTARWDVALSNDNGATWEEVTMDSTLLDCAARELVGNVWKARFTVQEGEVWKIRVNDDAGAFADNSGNMAYKFYVLCEGTACTGSVPDDGTDGIPAITIQGGGNVCQLAVLRPGPLGVAEIFDLGNYLASWVQYANLSILRYMAWCPQHTGLITTFLNGFRTKEPLATLDELNQLLQYVKNELDSYDWGEWEDTSLFSIDGAADVRDLIDDHIIRRDAEVVNPWQGNELLEFGNTTLPASYYACNSAFANGLPTRLRSAVCFVSAYFKETGAAFWVQLLIIDIPAVGILLVGVTRTVEQILVLMTGVDFFQRNRKINVVIEQARSERRR